MLDAMEQTATTAAQYFDRYEALYRDGALRQGVFNSEENGRHVACALGALGSNVKSVSDCPATVMPRWLAQMVPWFFDRQKADQAYAWGLDFAAELKRLNGKVPFSVVYDWHANVVCSLGIEEAVKQGRDTASHEALRALHLRAVAGDIPKAEEWRPVLRYAYAYAYADANADAYAYAYAYADAYANAYAYADAYAYANAYANADAYANAYADAINRLASGLVECLRRAAPTAEV